MYLQLFLLEEEREKRFDHYARVIQKAFRKYINQVTNMRQKEEAAGKAKSRLRFFSTFYCSYAVQT